MSQGKILVVEDDSTMLKLVKLTLESVGFIVHGASDAPEALKLLSEKSGEIAVALIDYELPGSRLDDLLCHVRSQPSPIRVIVTSGYSLDMLDEFGGSIPPGVEFLKKPFMPRELVNTVRHAFTKVSGSGA